MADPRLPLLVPMAQPTRRSIRRRESPAAAIEGLLDDPTSAEWLLFLARHYARDFDSVAEICILLSQYAEMVYLLDFDVIRNHLERRSLENVDTFVVDFLFFRSEAKFALPDGAWAELCEYFARLAGVGRRLRVSGQNRDSDSAIREVAEGLKIHRVNSLSTEILTDEIAGLLSQHSIELAHLIGMLRSSRFIGVVAECREDHRQAWLGMVNAIPRSSASPRTLKDERDAVNIAVATSAIRPETGSETGPPTGTCYVLVSQTRAILNLMRSLEDAEIPQHAGGVLPDVVARGLAYPVVHPRQAVAMELMGGLRDPTVAHRRAKALRNDFRQVKDFFEERILGHAAPAREATYEKALSRFMDEERERIQKILSRFSTEMLGKPGDLRRIEETRSTAASIEVARRRARGQLFGVRDDLLQKSTVFLRALGEVAEAFGRLPQLRYEARSVTPTAPAIPFTRIEIRQPQAAKTLEALVSLELYPLRWDSSAQNRYYSARWPIFCSDDELVAGLSSVLIVEHAACSTMPRERGVLHLRPVEDPEDDLWQEGLVVSTSLGDYGMDLAWACDDSQLNTLTLTRLGELVRVAVAEELKPRPDFVPEIQQIRLNTVSGDFVFDVTPSDNALRRYLTVLSHCDLSTHISMLYDHTGPLYCIPSRLEAALHSVLKGFPPPPRPSS